MNKKKRGNILVSSHFIDKAAFAKALYEVFTPIIISVSENGQTLEMSGYCDLFDEAPGGHLAPLHERFLGAPFYDLLFEGDKLKEAKKWQQ